MSQTKDPQSLHPRVDLIAIGCSAGGIEALKEILPKLPENFPIPIVVIQHLGPKSGESLPKLFASYCKMPVKEAEDKEFLRSSTIYFAPANYHLMLEADRSFTLSVEEPVNFVRPAIDLFFETAARVYNERLMGIVLTGANQDGAEGLLTIQKSGGWSIVQNPQSARYPIMPLAALAKCKPDRICNLNEISETLMGMV